MGLCLVIVQPEVSLYTGLIKHYFEQNEELPWDLN